MKAQRAEQQRLREQSQLVRALANIDREPMQCYRKGSQQHRIVAVCARNWNQFGCDIYTLCTVCIWYLSATFFLSSRDVRNRSSGIKGF